MKLYILTIALFFIAAYELTAWSELSKARAHDFECRVQGKTLNECERG